MVAHYTPGVYIEDLSAQHKAIQGISTSVAAFIGLNSHIRADNTPKLIASYQEFSNLFGECSDRQYMNDTAVDNYLAYAVNSFFANGGRKCYVAAVPALNLNAIRAALTALESLAEISLLAAPGYSTLPTAEYEQVTDLLVKHCEKMRYRIALLDAPPNASNPQLLDTQRQINSVQAAFYAPWVIVHDGRSNEDVCIPPSGAVAGVYARVDMNYGVWKAPANDEVRGIIGFERDINHREQSELVPQGINVLRTIATRGYRIWGVRTTSDDVEWRYLPVRRTALYIEHSIKQGLQWAVFEPNTDALWASVQSECCSFLDKLWRWGAFQGSKPAEAYFVDVNRETMTQKDILAGRLKIKLGFAPLKPAEFVDLRICIMTRPGTY